jgi:DNA-binding CsgD family transcriptional regulator/tetratricopeptide (TPR) repeat protein
MELLERERHLKALDGWLRETAAGEGRLVFVGGEAGVGKTALVDEFRRVAHGRARVLWGSCDARCTPGPLGPLHDIASDAGGELNRLLDRGASRDQVFRAALTEFRGGLTPSLVVIEDVHWADEATLDLLRFLGRRLEPLRSMIVVTYRDDEVGPAHPWRQVMGDLATTRAVRRLQLEPLSVDGIRALAAGSGFDSASLHRLTGGNPFFATEVLADEDAVGGIPATVRDAVLARAAWLSPEGRDALDAAAVIGSPISADLLMVVSEATAETVDECLAGGMLVFAGERAFAFRHELARTAIYDAISPPRRADLHARVLCALEAGSTAGGAVALLAHHAEAAGDHTAVLAYAPEAGRVSSVLGANREATAQYARALRFADELPAEQRLALLESYAEVSDLAGAGGAAVAAREEMIALARQIGDRRKEAEHLGWLADTLAVDGHFADATRAADAALALLAGMPEGTAHAWAYGHQAQVRLAMGEMRSAIDWGERAIALSTRDADVRSLAKGLLTVGEARLKSGDEARGRHDLERCVAIAGEAGLGGFVSAALANLGSSHAEIFCFDLAETYLTEAIAHAGGRGDDNWRYWSVVSLALVRIHQGRWAEAAELAGSVLRLPAASLEAPHEFGVPVSVRMIGLVALGRVQARRGGPDAASVLDQALDLASGAGPLHRRGLVQAARAEAAWLAGDHVRAGREARAVLDLPISVGSQWDVGELYVWLKRAGAPALPPDAVELPAPHRQALAGDWAGAAAAWEALDCPYEAALARLDGDEASLRDALTTFERLGAKPAAALATQRLRTLGVRGIPRGPRPATRANPANLTARELQILPMVIAGQRNADIAASLFLSPKTVEHHVSSILAKLGVGARNDLAGAVAQLGADPRDQLRGTLAPT